jgi:hypothetical protein
MDIKAGETAVERKNDLCDGSRENYYGRVPPSRE